MKKLLFRAAMLLLLLPVCVSAQSVLDGTWKFDPTQGDLGKKPWVYIVDKGIYDCRICSPKVKIPADGADHPVAGSPYYDTSSFRIVDAQTFEEVRRKAGKEVSSTKFKVAPDGKTMTLESSDTNASVEPVTSTSTYRRVAAGPAGAASLSGSWRIETSTLSDNAASFTLKTEGDMLTSSSPTGQSFSARLDGSEAPYKGDPGQDTISVRKLSALVYLETDKRDGKIIGTSKWVVAADGKSMAVHWVDTLHKTSGVAVNVKQ